MNMPLVTVVMPVYNAAPTLARAIESILHQTYVHWELLILNDGSTDHSLQVAQTYRDPRILVLTDHSRKGIVYRLNQGIALAQGAYIARMDADDVSYPHRLAAQIAFLEAHPEVDLVGGAIRLVGGQYPPQIRRFSTDHGAIVDQPWKKTLSLAHPTWCGRRAWFRRWLYQPFRRNEDQELLLRASSSSVYGNLPDVLLDYTVTHSLRKILLARFGWLHVLWVHYGRQGQVGDWAKGTMVVLIKIFKDLYYAKNL